VPQKNKIINRIPVRDMFMARYRCSLPPSKRVGHRLRTGLIVGWKILEFRLRHLHKGRVLLDLG
jgi:hypothetical protein